MATTKTTRKTTRKATTTTSKPRSRAAQRLAEQPTVRPPFEIVSEAAVKSVKFGIGTTLVVRDTVKKFLTMPWPAATKSNSPFRHCLCPT